MNPVTDIAATVANMPSPSGPERLPPPSGDGSPEPWSFEHNRPQREVPVTESIALPFGAPERVVVKAAPDLPGTACTLTIHGDPMLFGVPSPGVGRLPVMLDGPVSVEVDGVQVDLAPCAGAYPYFPKRIIAAVVAALPKSAQPVVERDHPLVRKAFAAELAKVPQCTSKAPLSVFDHADTLFSALCELARSYGLPLDVAASMLQRWSPFEPDETKARLGAVYASGGHCAPGTKGAELIEAEVARLERQHREEAAIARNAAQVTERVEYDLREQGWLRIERTSAPARDDDPVRRRLECHLPQGSTYVRSHLLFDGQLLPTVSVHSRGTVALTRAEASQVGIGSAALQRAIADAREMSIEPRSYSEQDFIGDARTIEGKAALEQFRTWANKLASGDPGLDFWTLPVALGGRVDLENAAAILAEVLEAFDKRARPPSKVLHYGQDGVRNNSWEARARWVEQPSPLPRTVPTAAQAPGLMLRALTGVRQVWSWGELYTPPSPADIARLGGVTLETAVAEYAKGRNELRHPELVEHLHDRGVLPGVGTSPQQRDQIRAMLESLGYEQTERRRDGRHYRVWAKATVAPSDTWVAALERLEETVEPATLARLREEHPETFEALAADSPDVLAGVGVREQDERQRRAERAAAHARAVEGVAT